MKTTFQSPCLSIRNNEAKNKLVQLTSNHLARFFLNVNAVIFENYGIYIIFKFKFLEIIL